MEVPQKPDVCGHSCGMTGGMTQMPIWQPDCWFCPRATVGTTASYPPVSPLGLIGGFFLRLEPAIRIRP
jgi:hypothetical protein